MPKIELYNDDCLEVMKDIPEKSIDLILCDLPYGTTRNKWDCPIDLGSLWREYERIIKNNGAILLFAQTPFDKVLGASNLKLLKYEWIWEKEMGTGFLNAKKMPLKNHENILVFYKSLPHYNPQMREGTPYSITQGGDSTNYGDYHRVVTENNGERYPVTIVKFNRDKKKLHPTQKPVALCEYFIKTYTTEGATVLDNCAGSMSTVIASLNTKRKCIAIEKDGIIFKTGSERVRKHILDNNLDLSCNQVGEQVILWQNSKIELAKDMEG